MEKKLFAVHGGPSIYALVQATDKEDALNVFAKGQIEDETIREEIDNFIVNGSLLEKFYRDEKGSFFEDLTGEVRSDLQHLSEDKLFEYQKKCITENVYEFWGKRSDLADEYLAELNKSLDSEDFYTANFSEEFYIETIKLIIQGGNWFNDFEIVEVESSSNYQVIFQE